MVCMNCEKLKNGWEQIAERKYLRNIFLVKQILTPFFFFFFVMNSNQIISILNAFP